MPTRKPQKKTSKKKFYYGILVLFAVIVVLIVITNVIIPKIKYDHLHGRVLNIVQKELYALDFADMSGVHKAYDMGCDYDFKTRDTRCLMSYNRYFGTNESNPEKVYEAVYDMMSKQGWLIEPNFDSSSQWNPQFASRYFTKTNGITLRATLKSADKTGLGNTASDYIKISNESKYVYSIDVETDKIPKKF